jgi:thiamine biosynthesis lipoprotein
MTAPAVTAPAVDDRGRTLHVEHCMGTVFTFDIRDRGNWDDAIVAAVEWLHHVDHVFSTYRPDSDISRLALGEIRLAETDPDVSRVLDLAAEVSITTGGYFTAQPHGRLDPTGVVKGWAIEAASQLLHHHGSHNHAVNGGGDIRVAGLAAPGAPWRIGINDPLDRNHLLTVVSGRDFAVASSGRIERGDHIVVPFTRTPAVALAGVTVTGPSLTYADAYATAAFAMGDGAFDWLGRLPDYDGLVVDALGAARCTRSLSRVIASSSDVGCSSDGRSRMTTDGQEKPTTAVSTPSVA